MNKLPGFDLIERARALAPMIAREADEIERTRRLTLPVVSALIENGLYRALLPKSAGGAEVPLEVFMQMLEEVAKADASTAWCLGQCSVCAMTAAYLDPDTAREMFGAPTDILAWGAIAGEVQVVPGGYRADGRWDFASGSRQANWLGAHVQVVEADGTRRRKRDGDTGNPHHPVSDRKRHDVRRLGRDRPARHRHRQLFGRQSVHPGKVCGAARRSRRGARKRPALPAHHQHRFRDGLRRGRARRRPRHARCRDRSGARQGVGRRQGDAREQCGAGRARPYRR